MSAMTKTLAAAALCVAGLAFAPPTAAQERVLTIFGDDKCPAETICVIAPENERYRIPKELRETETAPQNQSWAVRSEGLSELGKTGPNSCSAVGPAGWTGCWAEQMRAARQERQAAVPEGPEQ